MRLKIILMKLTFLLLMIQSVKNNFLKLFSVARFDQKIDLIFPSYVQEGKAIQET